MAGPFDNSNFENLVPADKKLDPQWIASLFARGSRTVYRGDELTKIGMPVGGICCGQIYVGGDGRLWHWDIFNELVRTRFDHYAEPPLPVSKVFQGFAMSISGQSNGGWARTVVLKKRDAASPRSQPPGFSDVTFCGEYPIAHVEYKDPAQPVAVSMAVFSPFIPLNVDDSSLPATIIQIKIKNTGDETLKVDLLGYLGNAVGCNSKTTVTGTRENLAIRHPRLTTAQCSLLPDQPASNIEMMPDFGTMVLGLLNPKSDDTVDCDVNCDPDSDIVLGMPCEPIKASREFSSGETKQLVAGLKRSMTLSPGQECLATYVIAWCFPNLTLLDGGRYYANRFTSARAVAEYVAENFDRLADQTRLWHDTWYDSTLPYWFLDRTFLNTSILATSTCHRFKSGRFYGWEGVGCCEGTCTHVWHYAQAVARLFPELERDLRCRVDFGLALDLTTGVINHRGEQAGLAVDGQAGCILRAYREHLMSTDGRILAELWPKIKLAMRCLIALDPGERILEAPQHNTLDRAWFGKVAWLSSLYLAAARACKEMAKEVGDQLFAAECHDIAEQGRRNIDAQLFNGEYYIQLPDAVHPNTVGSYDGCEIDQVFGQSWAWQIGLGRILNAENVKQSLSSLWRYNFTPDVGPFRKQYTAGRWFAMPGEAGLLMCSWPKGDKARVQEGPDLYFNECMTGFEYQVAGHMIWEGMVQEGLAVTRAVHDRYHAARRNPWNEVECGDHYARAMASYGVFLAACGYEYNGPKGHLAFAPRLTPENFRAAFTTAEGWGTFSQKRDGQTQEDAIHVRWGRLRVRTLSLAIAEHTKPSKTSVAVGGRLMDCTFTSDGGQVHITLAADAIVEAGQWIQIQIV